MLMSKTLAHRLHPDLRQIYGFCPESDPVADVAYTRSISRLPEPFVPGDNLGIEREEISGGGYDIPVRIYRPSAPAERRPALLYIHGGGYVIGDPELNAAECANYALSAGCVVVAPSYRLAPEHKFPAAIDDCYATLLWMSANAARLGIDPGRIAVLGESAGGGLTAATCLRARDERGPGICLQVLLYPMLDSRNITPSSYEVEDKKVWNRHCNVEAWKMYLGRPEDGVNPYASPTHAANLAGLPPTYMVVGQLDLFRDEDMDYAARLIRAEVPVELHIYPGAFHGFISYAPNTPLCRRASGEYIEALCSAFAAKERR